MVSGPGRRRTSALRLGYGRGEVFRSALRFPGIFGNHFQTPGRGGLSRGLGVHVLDCSAGFRLPLQKIGCSLPGGNGRRGSRFGGFRLRGGNVF